jgi:hypothetical protein
MAIGKYKGAFKVDASGAATATTDYSADIIDLQLPYTKNVGSHFTIASQWRQSTEGGMQFEMTATVRYSNTASSAYQIFTAWAIAGGARTIEAYTPDSTTGSGKISGEFICVGPDNGMDISGGSGDVQSMKFKFQSDSTVTVAIA